MRFFELIGEITKLNWRLLIDFWWVWLIIVVVVSSILILMNRRD